jgi:hypothetical protein
MRKSVGEQVEKWSKVALWIGGDMLRPEEISTLLDLQPSQTGLKGEGFGARNVSVRHTSFWLLNSPLSVHAPLTDHLNWLLEVIDPKLDSINSLVRKWKVEIFCGFSSESGQGGVTFDPNLLRRLAQLGVPLVLDLYPPGNVLESVDSLVPHP